MLHLTSVAVALALTSALALANSAGPFPNDGFRRDELRGILLGETTPYRAPQPNQSLPGAAPRPSNPDMRVSPSMGGRSMRGGGRVNGSMGRR